MTRAEWSCYVDRDIARRCCVTNTFVSNLRASLVTVTSERCAASPDALPCLSWIPLPLWLQSWRRKPFNDARRRLALRGFCAAARYGPCLTAGPIFSVQQLFVLLLEIACADFEILQDLLGEEMQIGRDPAQNEGEVMTLIVSQVFAILADGKPTLAFEAKNMTEALAAYR